MRTKDLGFNKDQVIAFPLNGKRNDQQALQLLRDALEDKTNIVNITASNNILGLGKDGSSSTSVLGFDYKGRGVETHMLVVDVDYIKTLDLDLVEGRSFRKNLASDSLSVIINESMAKQLKEEEVLNSKIILNDSVTFSVVGVIKDFNFQELDRNIEPMSLFALPNWNLRNVYVKVAPQDLQQAYDDVKAAWASIEPNAEFQGSFLNENIDRTLRKRAHDDNHDRKWFYPCYFFKLYWFICDVTTYCSSTSQGNRGPKDSRSKCFYDYCTSYEGLFEIGRHRFSYCNTHFVVGNE